MAIIFAVGIGLILGSFLSVLLERLDRKEGIVAGRSECPHCHHILVWHDLIPLVSYITLRGRCRYCRAPISPLYPALEVVMATVLGLAVALHGAWSLWNVIDLLLLFGLVALFFFDLKYQMLPDVIMYPMIGITLLRLITQRPDMLLNAVAAGVFLAAVLGLLYVYSRGQWLGFGDVKLAVLMGLLFGYPFVVGVTLLAIWLGALVGVGLMLARRAHMQTALPFGSFWTAVAIMAILWPDPIAFVSGLIIPAFS